MSHAITDLKPHTMSQRIVNRDLDVVCLYLVRDTGMSKCKPCFILTGVYQYLQCRVLQRGKQKHWIYTIIIYKFQLFRKLKKGLWKHVCMCFLWLMIKDNGIIHSPKIHFKLLPYPLYYKITHKVVNRQLLTITVFDIDLCCLFNRLGTASNSKYLVFLY